MDKKRDYTSVTLTRISENWLASLVWDLSLENILLGEFRLTFPVLGSFRFGTFALDPEPG